LRAVTVATIAGVVSATSGAWLEVERDNTIVTASVVTGVEPHLPWLFNLRAIGEAAIVGFVSVLALSAAALGAFAAARWVWRVKVDATGR
jgi:hypothetical protein